MTQKSMTVVLYFLAKICFGADYVNCESQVGPSQIELTQEWSRVHQKALLWIHNKKYGYLATNSVEMNSFQYAFFATKNSLLKKSWFPNFTRFKMIKNSDDTVSIISENGEPSYLAIPLVSEGSYQYAIFATKEYLAKHPSYSQKFKLVDNANGLYCLESEHGGVKSYLAMGELTDGSYQWAYFASPAYISNHKGIASFYLNPSIYNAKKKL